MSQPNEPVVIPGLDTEGARYFAIGKAFFILLILSGNVGLPAMLIITFIRRNHYAKSPIFINFIVSFIGYSTAFLLSFYAGTWEVPDMDTTWSLCGLQAIMAYVSPVWACTATFTLSFQLWACVRESGSSKKPVNDGAFAAMRATRTMILVILPYVVNLVFILIVFLVARARPELVGLRYLFCSVNFQPLRLAASIYDIFALVMTIALQADVARRLYRRGFSITQVRVQGWQARALFIRMSFFLVAMIISIAAAFLASSEYGDSQRELRMILQALVPVFVTLIFGSNVGIYQKDDSVQCPLDNAAVASNKETFGKA